MTNEPQGPEGGRPPASAPPVPIPAEAPRQGPLEILWRQRWTVVAVTILALAGGVAYLLVAPPRYVSVSKIQVEAGIPKIAGETEAAAAASKNFLNNQVECLQSSQVLKAALDSPGVRDLKIFENAANPVAWLKKHLDIRAGTKDDFLTVSLEAKDPKEAAEVVNAVVEAYLALDAAKKKGHASAVLELLRKEKHNQELEVAASAKALKAYRDAHPGAVLAGGDKGQMRLQRLSEMLTAAKLATLDAQITLQTIRDCQGDPERARRILELQDPKGQPSATDTEAARLRAEIDQQQQRLASLKQRATSNVPAVRTAEERVDALRRELADLNARFIESAIATLEKQRDAAQDRENQTHEMVQHEQTEVLSANQELSDYMQKEQAYQGNLKLAEALGARLKDIEASESAGPVSPSISEVAVPAEEPSSPRKGSTMAVALLLGLLLGSGAGFLRHGLDQHIRSSEEVTAALGLPILGAVPQMILKDPDAGLRAYGLRVLLEPRSLAAEAFRTIRTAIYFGAPKAHARTIVVTSAEPGDGKSIVVSNLAIAMAQAGQRVLVIDADFHRPVQHEIFGTKARNRLYRLLKDHFANVVDRLGHVPPEKAPPSSTELLGSKAFDDMLRDLASKYERPHKHKEGLSNVLAGRQTLASAIIQTAVPNLDLLPCGTIPPNPAELLNSEAFSRALTDLTAQYDHILLDAPPVLAVADARILGAMATMTLVIVRAEKTSRRRALQACEALRRVGARLFGAVINGVPPRKDDSYGYGGYLYRSDYVHEKGGAADAPPAAAEAAAAAKGDEYDHHT